MIATQLFPLNSSDDQISHRLSTPLFKDLQKTRTILIHRLDEIFFFSPSLLCKEMSKFVQN
jgi:hypothetical protein